MRADFHGPGYAMGWIGAQRQVLAGDLSARADLREFAATAHLHALGPREALQGEITVVDGVPFISTVAAGAVAVERSFAHRACFLVYAQVPRWRWAVRGGPLPGLADLEPILGGASARSGIGPDDPYPFFITGRAALAAIHVLDKRDGLPHSPERHEEAKVHFTLSDEEVELVGFHSTCHQGVFVPRASTMHIHLTARGGHLAGHVDALQLTDGWRLALPAAGGPEEST